MELILEHFRCFSQVKLTLPSTGILLLNGPSGIGKSTIFKAIHFVLYGKEQKVVQFGQKRAKVTLKTTVNDLPITIIRATNPSSLTVHYNQTTEIKDSAQALIINLFGNYFCQTSYLSQKSVENFLSLSQNERTSFLESCNATYEPIQALKETCKQKIRDRKAAVSKAQTEVATLAPLVPTDIGVAPIYPYTDKTPDQEMEERQKNKTKLEALRETLNRLQSDQSKYCAQESKLQQLESEHKACNDWLHANPPLEKQYNKNSIKQELTTNKKWLEEWEQLETLDQIQSNLGVLTQQREEALAKCLLLYSPFDAVEYNKVVKELQRQTDLLKQIQAWNTILPDPVDPLCEDPVVLVKQQVDKLIDECIDELSDYDTTELAAKAKSCSDAIALLNQEIKSTTLAVAGKMFHCPSCKNGLSFSGGSGDQCLVLFDKKKEEQKLEKLNTDLKAEKKKLSALEKEISVRNSNLAEIQSELSDWKRIAKEVAQIKGNNCNKIDELKAKEKKLGEEEHTSNALNKQILELRQPSKKEKELQKQIKELDGLQRPVKSKQECKDQINTLQSIYILACEEEVRCNELQKKRDEMEEKVSRYSKILNEPRLSDCSEKITEIQDEVARRLAREEKFAKRQKKIDIYNQALKEYNLYFDAWKRLNKAKSEVVRWEQATVVAEKGYACLVEAETAALLQTLNTVNLELDQFTSAFFDNKLSIALRAFKETAKGEKRHCIDLQITREGEDVSIDSLSGGEYDRCVLALFLSFNLVTKRKWLLLDECLSSLHAEAVEDILEYIKDKWKDQLVCVTLHQANTGMFDDVIDVCCLQS